MTGAVLRRRLEELEAAADARALELGHRMHPWQEDAGVARAFCRRCGRGAEVNARPAAASRPAGAAVRDRCAARRRPWGF